MKRGEAFDDKYEVIASGCWEWRRGRSSDGYGKVAVGRTTMLAHRISYELHVGPIPSGLTLDHLCRNRACVNPAHLEPVTNRENVLRGIGASARNARKTHCVYGHKLTKENMSMSRGGRRCLVCCRRRGLSDRRAANAKNMHDKENRLARRRHRGSENGRSRLTESMAAGIRALYATGDVSQRSIAARFGVNPSTVCRVIRRKVWRHV